MAEEVAPKNTQALLWLNRAWQAAWVLLFVQIAGFMALRPATPDAAHGLVYAIKAFGVRYVSFPEKVVFGTTVASLFLLGVPLVVWGLSIAYQKRRAGSAD